MGQNDHRPTRHMAPYCAVVAHCADLTAVRHRRAVLSVFLACYRSPQFGMCAVNIIVTASHNRLQQHVRWAKEGNLYLTAVSIYSSASLLK